MTHDELLILVTGGTNHTVTQEHLLYRAALRAVVELHKPIQMRMPHGAIYCMGCGRDHEFNDYWIEYPCETIKTIEKELA